KDNLLWQQKFETHFPHALSNLSTQDTINWYDEFQKSYENDYKKLSANTKELFSLVKEGDIHQLKNRFNILRDLKEKDDHGAGLVEWAKKKGNQALLDFFYELITKEFINNKGLN